ncbi:MAG: DUF4230 domain-containing protein [Bacteroidales bacterium]|nr:DUF4230 domain-containing protein [Bacteroidales bacterium]
MNNSDMPNGRSLINIKFSGGFGCWVVVAVLLCGMIYAVKSCSIVSIETKEKIEFSDVQIESQLRKEWGFYRLETLVNGKSEGYTGEYVCQYSGVILLGIDLTDCYDFVTIEDDELVVRAPQIKILNNDFIDDTKTVVLKDFPFLGADDNDRIVARKDAEAKMLEEAYSDERIRLAETSGRKEIERVIKNLGYKGRIRITFSKDLNYGN